MTDKQFKKQFIFTAIGFLVLAIIYSADKITEFIQTIIF